MVIGFRIERHHPTLATRSTGRKKVMKLKEAISGALIDFGDDGYTLRSGTLLTPTRCRTTTNAELLPTLLKFAMVNLKGLKYLRPWQLELKSSKLHRSSSASLMPTSSLLMLTSYSASISPTRWLLSLSTPSQWESELLLEADCASQWVGADIFDGQKLWCNSFRLLLGALAHWKDGTHPARRTIRSL